MIKKIYISLFVLACLQLSLLGHISLVQGADAYKVIVNADNPTTSLTKKKISNMFLNKVKKWDHGPKVKSVDQPASKPVRDKFSKDVHKKSARSIKSYWQQELFSGSRVPPAEKGSDSEVVRFVESNPGAIGYVSGSADVGSTKVINVQ